MEHLSVEAIRNATKTAWEEAVREAQIQDDCICLGVYKPPYDICPKCEDKVMPIYAKKMAETVRKM